MASNYGYNFGFRRSDESYRSSEGRFRTPATGAPLLIGTAVKIDPAKPGYMTVAAANDPIVPGVCGLLVQEEQWDLNIFQASTTDTHDLGVAHKDKLSVITTGASVKVWYKNTLVDSRRPEITYPAVTMADLTGVALGDKLGWDGTKFVKVAANSTSIWFTVTAVNTSTGYFEGVLAR
ncbi:hypothetical protein EON82_24505 [bacterium]|nr:MAG: hypothetical protein EON82_24505 [bacterium]